MLSAENVQAHFIIVNFIWEKKGHWGTPVPSERFDKHGIVANVFAYIKMTILAAKCRGVIPFVMMGFILFELSCKNL